MIDDTSLVDLIHQAVTLTQRQVHSEALEAWKAVMIRHPSSADGYRGTAEILRQLDRVEEADTTLQKGMLAVPSAIDLAVARAQLATTTASDFIATERWDVVIARFPEEPDGYIGLAALLHDRQRIRLADIVLTGASIKFAASSDVAINLARVAVSAGRHDDALKRWLAVVDRFPDLTVGYFGAAASCRVLGNPAEADRLIRDAQERFPDDVGVACDLAELAREKGEWDEAIRQWDVITQKYAHDKDIMRQVSHGIGRVELARFQERLSKAAKSVDAA